MEKECQRDTVYPGLERHDRQPGRQGARSRKLADSIASTPRKQRMTENGADLESSWPLVTHFFSEVPLPEVSTAFPNISTRREQNVRHYEPTGDSSRSNHNMPLPLGAGFNKGLQNNEILPPQDLRNIH